MTRVAKAAATAAAKDPAPIATVHRLKLPPILRPHAAALSGAIADHPLPMLWPEGEKGPAFAHADQAAAIALTLIEALHPWLKSARIVYLFRERIASKGKDVWGTASRLTGRTHYLTDLDFALEFNFSAWRFLTPEARIALVDHELSHCGYDADTDGWTLVPHDVEEFGHIVGRWGLWKSDLRLFSRPVVRADAQGDLFNAPADAQASADTTADAPASGEGAA